MRKRNWSVEEKFAIVMEGLKGIKPVAQICRENKISQPQYYKWRDKFLESGKQGLNGHSQQNNSHQAEIERLQKIIGKQTVTIEILKKSEELMNGH
jgi:transposase